MAVVNYTHFDVHEFTKKSKEPATKGDLELTKLELRKEITDSKLQTIIWVCGFILASGIFQHFLK